jgi:phage tail P2-like protein
VSDVLLPGNATSQERDVEQATARIGELDAQPISDQWDPWACPDDLLPWLAWAFNVDEWDATWPEEFKRRTIAESVAIHRRKGTLSSIRRVIQNAGYGDATIIEGLSGVTYNGSQTHNGFITHGETTDWAKYRFILTRPITNAQADQVRRILSYTAPARCSLEELIYVEANNAYDGAIFYNGTFNHGTA